jgi:hypothetical protein
LVADSKFKTPRNFFADGGLQVTSTEQDLSGSSNSGDLQSSLNDASTPNGAALTENEEISALSVCERFVIVTTIDVSWPTVALLNLTGSGLKWSLGQPVFGNFANAGAVPVGPSSPSSSTATTTIRFARVIAFSQHRHPEA